MGGGGGNTQESKTRESKTSLLNKKREILSPNSLIFNPIDTLESALFATNSCEYLPKLYGIWKSVENIDFESLPSSFVLKTNHDSGGVVLVPDKTKFLKDKATFQAAINKLKQNLSRNYYPLYREWHMRDIEPRIFAEELLGLDESSEYHAPRDYKFHTFDNAYFIHTSDKISKEKTRAILNENWELMPFDLEHPRPKTAPKKPENLDEMALIANALAYGFGATRADLYSVNDKVYVGEITFTSSGGTDHFSPAEWDKKWGDLWLESQIVRG